MPILLESPRKIVHDALKENMYTPDMLDIQGKHALVPLFVWGTEKKGFSEAGAVQGQYIGSGFSSSVFVLRVQKKSALPMVFYQPTDPQSARVQGEVYLVPPQTLFHMDQFYTHTIYTRRLSRYITFRKKEDEGKTKDKCQWFRGECWMYQAIPDNLSLQDFRDGFLMTMTEPYWIWRKVDEEKAIQSERKGVCL